MTNQHRTVSAWATFGPMAIAALASGLASAAVLILAVLAFVQPLQVDKSIEGELDEVKHELVTSGVSYELAHDEVHLVAEDIISFSSNVMSIDDVLLLSDIVDDEKMSLPVVRQVTKASGVGVNFIVGLVLLLSATLALLISDRWTMKRLNLKTSVERIA